MLLVLNKAVVHFVGDYAPDRVEVLLTQRRRRSDPELEKRVAEAWEDHPDLQTPAGPDEEIARLVAHGVLPDRVVLYVGRTTRREFVGTNLTSGDLHESLGDDCYANPLRVRAAVVTRDESVLLARLSAPGPDSQGQWDLPSALIPFDAERGGAPFEVLGTALARGLGVLEEDVERIACAGLVEDGFTHVPELIFRCQVGERARTLLKRVREAGNTEYNEYMCVPVTKGDLLELMRRRGDELTPAAAGGLAIFVA